MKKTPTLNERLSRLEAAFDKAAKPRRIPEEIMARSRVKPTRQDFKRVFEPRAPLVGVVPKNHKIAASPMAMDQVAMNDALIWAQSSLGVYWSEGLMFMGYPELANLTVRPEYRVISQVIATEMTRKWITFQSVDQEKADEEELAVGEEDDDEVDQEPAEDAFPFAPPAAADPKVAEGIARAQEAKARKDELKAAAGKERAQRLASGKADRINELEKEFKRLKVRELFTQMAEYDGYFGRMHLFIDVGSADSINDLEELKMPLFNENDDGTLDLKIKQGSLRRLAAIEPVWTYPQYYNSSDPLSPDWYYPSTWFVMGKQVHRTRLLTFIGRPVPDILKPAYSFGGLSLSQIAKPYIDNWLQTRQSVNDIIRAFSVMVIATDMSSVLQASDANADGSALFDRIDLFNQFRDNRGTFVINKDTEDFKNVAAPLSSLDALQAQAQEHMASITRIPLVKLLGVSPAGLNASSEGELKTFYDTIAAFQEFFFRPNLTRVMHMAMVNLWGEIDEDIDFKFEPLWALNEKEEAEVRKIEAETADIYVNGVAAIHPEEVRAVLAKDPNSPYEGIDIADVPDAPVDDAINLKGSEPFEKGAQGELEGNQPPFAQAAE